MMTNSRIWAMTIVAVMIGVVAVVLIAQATRSNPGITAFAKSHRLAVMAGPCDRRAWVRNHQACLTSINGNGRTRKIYFTEEIRQPDRRTSVLIPHDGRLVTSN